MDPIQRNPDSAPSIPLEKKNIPTKPIEVDTQSVAADAEIVNVRGAQASLVKALVPRSQIQPHFDIKKAQLPPKMIPKMVSYVKQQSEIVAKIVTTYQNIKAAAQDIKSTRDLTNKLGITSKEEITTEGGVTQFSRLNKIDREFAKFTEFFTKNLIQKLSKGFFPLYFRNVQNKSLQKKYETFNKDLQVLKNDKQVIQGKIGALEGAIQPSKEQGNLISNVRAGFMKVELSQLKAQLSKLDNKINNIEVKLLSTGEIKSALKAVTEERKGLSRSNPEDVPKIALNRQEKQRLLALKNANKALPKEVRNKINIDRERLAKYESYNKKGIETRERLVKIGGEQIELETRDGAKLNGVFVDASKFREKLASSGGEFVTFSAADGSSLKGISFDFQQWEDSGKGVHIIDVLRELNAISYKDDQIAGWTPVLYTPQDKNLPEKVVLVPTSSLPGKDAYNRMIKKRKEKDGVPLYVFSEKGTSNPQFQKIDKKSDGGTVIMSHGNTGVYEQYKDEAAAFLFQGMNVVLFNYRGVGLSEGVPSDTNYHEDIETVYQFTKKHTGQEDSQILFKGLCFGGGPSAYAAAKHPDCNLFLDQTYSSFRSIVKEAAQEMIEEKIVSLHEKFDPEETSAFAMRAKDFLQENLAPIVASCSSLLAPNFEVAKNLEKINGEKAILYVHDDEVIPLNNVMENIAGQKGGGNLKVIATEGEHANTWMDLGVEGKTIHRAIHKTTNKIKKLYDIGIERKALENKKDRIKTLQKRIKDKNLDKNEISSIKTDITVLKMERSGIKAEVKAKAYERESKLDQYYLERGLDRSKMEKAINTTHYHARDEMLNFLGHAKLSAPII